MNGRHYRKLLRALQIELVRAQRHSIETGQKILLLFEGRDTAGKDGTIKRITEHLSPRETRVVALGKPSDRDRNAWYFQRFVEYLPVAGEIVLFNRSWYNRAGVERVMGFCTEQEFLDFVRDVGPFERLLCDSGIRMFKYYLDISREEQTRRLESRRSDPLKQFKSSPIDAVALEKWDEYTAARDEMLRLTHSAHAPWTLVRADDKRATRINVIRHLLCHLKNGYDTGRIERPDESIVFGFDTTCVETLAK